MTLIDVRAGARRTITLQGAGSRTPAGFALSGALLVVLWNQTLEVYDAANGFRVREWGIRELTLDGGFVDVEGDWITHVARNNVYVHRISDGAEGRVPSERLQPARCDKSLNGQVEKIGLVYAARGYDEPGCDKSTLGLIPFDELGRYVSPGSG